MENIQKYELYNDFWNDFFKQKEKDTELSSPMKGIKFNFPSFNHNLMKYLFFNERNSDLYEEFLKDKDYPLYLITESVRKIKNEETKIDMIVSYIDDICYILEGYLDKKVVKIIASRFAGRSALDILRYMKYILDFFKSYKIIFRTQGEHMIFGANGKETEDTVIRFNDIMHSVERFQRDEYYTMVENPTTLEHKEIHDYGPWLKEDVDIKEIHVQ